MGTVGYIIILFFSSVILIGFQEALYQFPESNVTLDALNQSNVTHEAVIIKVDGKITEQTYLIDVTAGEGSARSGFDYVIEGGDAQKLTFLPDQQSLQFPFKIPKDSILEQDECFTISLDDVPEIKPRFETQGTNTTTTICISDRTRKITPNFMCEDFYFF